MLATASAVLRFWGSRIEPQGRGLVVVDLGSSASARTPPMLVVLPVVPSLSPKP